MCSILFCRVVTLSHLLDMCQQIRKRENRKIRQRYSLKAPLSIDVVILKREIKIFNLSFLSRKNIYRVKFPSKECLIRSSEGLFETIVSMTAKGSHFWLFEQNKRSQSFKNSWLRLPIDISPKSEYIRTFVSVTTLYLQKKVSQLVHY